MFSIHDQPARLCDGVHRRELLRVGGLSLFGLSLPELLRNQSAVASVSERPPMFGQAKNVIFLWLQGGPPQHETFDPKPDAPVEIRGNFQPISTNIPGIQFCELLPRTARIADKLAVVRSLSTDDNTHDTSGYWLLTGRKYPGPTARAIRPDDWPYLGSVVKMLRPSPELPPFTSVWLPDLMRLNDNVTPAGQTAGFLGKQWEPERVICNPALPGFQIESYSLPQEIPALRLSRRESLLNQVGLHFDEQSRGPAVRDYDYFTQEAFGLLTSGKARAAFDVEREPAALRDRYGRTQWGQCVLLARRLVEAGVRLVHVNWCREGGDTAIDNPMWDTHAQNGDRVKEVLCPQFDVGFTALIEDLEQRGLLSETLVVAVGEFGRTPKINSNGGRDHWGPVFSFALAGAGIKGGQVYGASDKQGAYPIANKVQPPEFTATLFHLLGIGQETTFPDRTGRPLLVTEGEPLHTLLGTEPATTARTTPGGDLARAAAYDPALLIDGNFESLAPLLSVDDRLSFRSWQALPLWEVRSPAAFAVQQVREVKTSRSGQQHVRLGFGLEKSAQPAVIPAGARLLLTQKLSSPRAGKYTFSIHACGGGSAAAFFEEFWQKNFTCRLLIFAYADLKQDPRQGREFASVIIRPRFVAEPTAADYQRFEVTTYLRSQDGGAMQTSKGVGVAVVVENTGAADVNPEGNSAFLCIDDVAVDFNPRPRDENVRI